MRRFVMSMAVGILALCARAGTAAEQTLPVPLNEIMPQLPPVPKPGPPPQPVAPCRFSTAVIPMGDVTPATRAEPTPDGVALYGGDGPTNDVSSTEEQSPPCPIQPN